MVKEQLIFIQNVCLAIWVFPSLHQLDTCTGSLRKADHKTTSGKKLCEGGLQVVLF